MITDKIENVKLYSGLKERIQKALEYIITTDLDNIKEGKYEIDGDNIYAMVNEYNTKDRSACFLEAHRKYIDIQYVVKGSELFGYAPFESQKPHAVYDAEKDFELFNEEPSFVKFDTGMFAIFFPGDLHMPGIKAYSSSKVKKILNRGFI
jgi:YhcH/YjgK/YiaL family protein